MTRSGHDQGVHQQSVYEAAGGARTFADLAHAWHARCLADPVVSHAFSHPGQHPAHTDRLAAYWAEALGGPADFTATLADQSHVLRLHSGNGEHDEMDRRAKLCFSGALDDVAITEEPLRSTLQGYFDWATDLMSSHPETADTVPAGLPMPHWTWDGPTSE